MWNRKTIKGNARVLLKANYLKVVVVGLILSFLVYSDANSARSATKGTDADVSAIDWGNVGPGVIIAAFIGVSSIVIIALLLNLLLSIFVWNPLQVGCQKVFVNCRYGNPEWKDMLFAFKNGYGHIGGIMFLRDVFNYLWTFLFIIPGIVKHYEYLMIPYLLAENPQMSRQEVFAESKRMMDGNKMDTFIMDLSFVGWGLLGILTFNILNYLYTNPYMELAHAELYHTLKNQPR